MASRIYNKALQLLVNGGIDLDTDDIRVALVMTNTTADTENDGEHFVSGIATLDEADATGYARIALTSEAVNLDDANDRSEFDSADISFTGLSGNASRAYQGLVFFKFVTNDAASPLICFHEFPSTVPATATQVDVTINAEGILQFKQAA